jgi:hypothetical protein
VSAFLDLYRHWSKRPLRLSRGHRGLDRCPMSDGYRTDPGELLSKGPRTFLWLIILVATVTAFLPGCLIPSQETLKKSPWPVQGTSVPEQEATPTHQTLVKPVIPPETSSKTESDNAPTGAAQGEAPQKIAAAPEPSPPAAPAAADKSADAQPINTKPEPEIKPPSKQWEDEKIKGLALELAKSSAAVVRLKVCYYVKNDEWWVTAYEDTGGPIELKQYIWNRDQEKLEPFLVLKTIARDRLEQHVHASEPDRACEVIPLPPKESKPPDRPAGA